MPFVKKTPVSASEEAELTQIYPPLSLLTIPCIPKTGPSVVTPPVGVTMTQRSYTPWGKPFIMGL